jgi:hypothetical protein
MKVFILKKIGVINSLKSILLVLLFGMVGLMNAQNTENRDGQWYYYDNGEYLGYYDENELDLWDWGVMFPAGSFTGNAITKISIFDCSPTSHFSLLFYNDGETEPVGDFQSYGVYNSNGSHFLTGSMEFVEYTLPNPCLIDPSKNVWVIVSPSYPWIVNIPYCTINDNPNSSWINYNGEWGSFESLTGQAGHNFMLRAYFEDTSINTIDEVHLNDFALPAWGAHPDFDLTVPSGAHYAVDAVSWYGGGTLGPNSVFTNENYDYDMSVFLTPEEGYGFSPSTEVYFDGDASIVGSIWVESDGRLRVNTISFHVTKPSGDLSYDFEDGTTQGWTSIDADGDGFNWYLSDSGIPHSGSYVMISKSWDTNAGALSPNNFLVSPEKGKYSQVSFWAVGMHPNWPEEKFGVAVSTKGNTDPSDFTTVALWIATDENTEYTADLSSYAGREIWVAIRHFDCTDQYALNIDDITLAVTDTNPITEIYVNGFTAPEWGEHPDFDVEVPEDAHYSIGQVLWEFDDYQMAPDDVFDNEEVMYYMTVILSPEEGYEFDPIAEVYFNGDASINDWYYNVINNDGSFKACTIDYQVTAPTPSTYTVTATVNPTVGGSITGGGTFTEGETCTLKATANSGYQFLNWTKNGAEVSSNATYTFTVTESAEYVANFIQSQTQTYTLTVSCDPTMGAVTGNGTYAEGTSVTVQAIPFDGYIFDHWNDNSTENPRNVTIESNMTLVAFFKQNGVNEYGLNALSVYPNPAKETIRINGLETDATIEIYNSLGAKVKTMNVIVDGEVNIGELSKGLYMLRCGNQTIRFVKE